MTILWENLNFWVTVFRVFFLFLRSGKGEAKQLGLSGSEGKWSQPQDKLYLHVCPFWLYLKIFTKIKKETNLRYEKLWIYDLGLVCIWNIIPWYFWLFECYFVASCQTYSQPCLWHFKFSISFVRVFFFLIKYFKKINFGFITKK